MCSESFIMCFYNYYRCGKCYGMKLGRFYLLVASILLVLSGHTSFGSPQDFLDRASALTGSVAGSIDENDDSVSNSIPHHHNNFGCDCMEYW
jgi:hypothetical protein